MDFDGYFGGDGAASGVCWLVPQVASEAREAWRRVNSGQPWPVSAAPSLASSAPFHSPWAAGDVFRRRGRNSDDWATWADGASSRAANWALQPVSRPEHPNGPELRFSSVLLHARVEARFCDNPATKR